METENQDFLSSQTNLLVIDSNVAGYQDLINGLDSNAEILILESNRDGVTQISEAIKSYEEVASIQIISHGETGSIQLGNTWLNSSNIQQYQDELINWGKVLTDDGDIFIYGCNVAAGKGANFVNALSDITGADVAASTDLTGSSILGGDGDQEYATGEIDSSLGLQAQVLEDYEALLVNEYVVGNDPNFVNELVLSGLDDPISMEWLPDGRALILSKNGDIQIADLEASIPQPSLYMSLPDVGTAAEKGLMDIALDPDFENNGYFYLYYTLGSANKFRVSRFEHQGNTGDVNSEELLWEDPNLAGSPDHYGGGLDFGPDGKLYLSFGDKGFSNPERAQDLSRYEGKVLRFNPDPSNPIPSDNPFINTPGALPEIWAYGLRNPFRANWDGNDLYIGDVGQDSWEEVNRIGINEAGANLGWNDFEGTSNGAPGLTDPIFQYPHPGSVGGAAVIGGSVYRGNVFPSEFQGAYFFMDFVQDYVKYLKFDASGNTIDADPSTPAVDAFNFDPGTTGPGGKYLDKMVFIDEGPDGALYLLSILREEVRRIVYNDPNSGNNPPVIDEQATTATPQTGLTVDFTAVASDPNPEDTLSYLWDFGDGNQSTEANPSHTYATQGEYTPILVVSDGQAQDSYTLEPVVLGSQPTANVSLYKDANLTTPFVEGVDLFKAGDTIYFEAEATDPDGVLTETSYNWDVRFIHDEHFHPEINDFVGSSGSFEITTTEHGFSADFQIGFQFVLTVTDSDGLTAIDSATIFPEKVDLSFNDNLPGDFDFTLDGFSRTSTDTEAFTVDTAVNFQHNAIADETIEINGVQYLFDSWSAGGTTVSTDNNLSIAAPDSDLTYIANYIVDDPNPDPDPPVAQDDSVSVNANSSGNILDVLSNDSDPDPGDTLAIVGLGVNNDPTLTTGSGGSVSINNDELIYTPAAGFVGTEDFTYTIEDLTGLTDTATVSVAVSEGSNLPVTDGLVLQLDADNGVSTDGTDLVTSWTDGSGSGNDLTAVGDPRLITNGLNGHNVISLDGDGDKLERLTNINLPSGGSDRTIFMVVNYNGTGDGGFGYGKRTKNRTFGLFVAPDGDLKVKAWGNSGDADSNVDGTGEGWLSQSVILEAGTMDHYKNGTIIDSKTNPYDTALDQIILGADIDNNPFVDMEVGEVLVFDRALSDTERQQVENYLQQKFNLGGSTGGGNTDPTAANDTAVTEQEVAVDINVLANDNDGDGDPLTLSIITDPTNGTAVVNDQGTPTDTSDDVITYTPGLGFTGDDSLTYEISDGNGGTAQADVAISVTSNGGGVVLESVLNFDEYSIAVPAPSGTPQVLSHIGSGGDLEGVEFLFDATNAGGNNSHFHQPLAPDYLTMHNGAGNGEQIDFVLSRQDGGAFALNSFKYTSGLQFPNAGDLNGSFSVIGTTATGDEISQTFEPAIAQQTFQEATLTGAGWNNLISVRWVGDRIATVDPIDATQLETTQSLNLDDIVVTSAI